MEFKTELQRNAVFTARRKELETYQRALDIQWLDGRMEGGGMGRCLALIKREAEMEKDFQERTDHAAIVNARAEKETNLGIEVAKVRREEACELLRRHYLRERDPSLRELQRKLQAGYVCRDQRLQIQNNEYKKLQEKAEDKQRNAILSNSLFNNQEALEREDREKMERNIAYRKELQKQLVERERVRQCTYEDTLIEKKMLEDIMRTLADEDQKELAQKRETTTRLRNEMETSRQARQAWKDKQKQMVINEEREIEKQKAAAADRSSAIVAERARKLKEKQDFNDKIAAKILADEAERQEHNDIIKLLQEQEYLEMNANEDITEKTKLERMKRETKEALTEQMEMRKKMAEIQKEREVAFRMKTEAKILAEEQAERELVARRREAGRAHAAALRCQAAAAAARRAAAATAARARDDALLRYHDAWRAEVSSEREEIVREHAPALLGYLQAGVVAASEPAAAAEGASEPAAAAEGAARRPAPAALDVAALAAPPRHTRFAKCNAQCRVLRDY